MPTSAPTVAEYLASLSPVARRYVKRVQTLVTRAVPMATPVISYRILGFRIPAGVFLYAAGWQEHYALYPATPRVLATYATELAAYEVRKGTIRFRYDQRLPAHLISAIAQLRAEETSARPAKRTKAARRRTPGVRAKPANGAKAAPHALPAARAKSPPRRGAAAGSKLAARPKAPARRKAPSRRTRT